MPLPPPSPVTGAGVPRMAASGSKSSDRPGEGKILVKQSATKGYTVAVRAVQVARNSAASSVSSTRVSLYCRRALPTPSNASCGQATHQQLPLRGWDNYMAPEGWGFENLYTRYERRPLHSAPLHPSSASASCPLLATHPVDNE